MPAYDVFCEVCDNRWEQEHSIKADHEPCPKCGGKARTLITDPHFIFDPANGWAHENGGKGHYFSSLETVSAAGVKKGTKKSNFAYCRSVSELKEKAARLGQAVTRDGF
jgi:putative FmdB family regulatory protein